MIDLGNEKDIADYVLHAHGSPRSSASASVDGGGGGGHETEASEEHAGVVIPEVGPLVPHGQSRT